MHGIATVRPALQCMHSEKCLPACNRDETPKDERASERDGNAQFGLGQPATEQDARPGELNGDAKPFFPAPPRPPMNTTIDHFITITILAHLWVCTTVAQEQNKCTYLLL